MSERSKQKKEEKRQKKAALSPKERKKHYLKRACVVILVLFAVLGAVLFAVKMLSDRIVPDEPFIEQISEVYPTFTPFPAEWKANLSEDADYLSLNTAIMYGTGESSSLYSLEDFYTSHKHEGQRFFEEYFRILREGDYEKYSSLFTDSYKNADPSKRFEKNVEREFPPQRVHDITVREMGRYENTEKNVIYGIYVVDYKINRNSNLFRNDIGWLAEYSVETSRPLYFHLVTYNPGTDNETTLISNMYTETTLKANTTGASDAEE